MPPDYTSTGEMYSLGDIVGFHPLITEEPNLTGRLAFVHVVDAPSISKIKDIIKEVSRPVIDEDQGKGKITLRSAWRLNLTDNNILTIAPTRQVTAPWSVIKDRLVRKHDGKTLVELYNELNP